MTSIKFRVSIVTLSAVLTLIACSTANAASPGVTTRTFSIPALSNQWIDTGLYLTDDNAATVSFLGSNATCHEGGAIDCPIGNPLGAGLTCEKAINDWSFPIGPAGPGAFYGVVYAKAGNSGAPQLVSDTFVTSGTGNLKLVFNDCGNAEGYTDNAGSTQVSVSADYSLAAPNHIARAGKMQGTIVVRHGSSAPVPLYAYDPLVPGDWVSTRKMSYAWIEVATGFYMRASSSTSIQLAQNSVRLLSGELWAGCGSTQKPLKILSKGHRVGFMGLSTCNLAAAQKTTRRKKAARNAGVVSAIKGGQISVRSLGAKKARKLGRGGRILVGDQVTIPRNVTVSIKCIKQTARGSASKPAFYLAFSKGKMRTMTLRVHKGQTFINAS